VRGGGQGGRATGLHAETARVMNKRHKHFIIMNDHIGNDVKKKPWQLFGIPRFLNNLALTASRYV
jgi:hypothetical protein